MNGANAKVSWEESDLGKQPVVEREVFFESRRRLRDLVRRGLEQIVNGKFLLICSLSPIVWRTDGVCFPGKGYVVE